MKLLLFTACLPGRGASECTEFISHRLSGCDLGVKANFLRVNEVSRIDLTSDDVLYDLGTNFSADFNDYNAVHDEHRLAILLTTFSILLLFVGMAVFVMDANKLSQQINIPLNELSKQVRSSSLLALITVITPMILFLVQHHGSNRITHFLSDVGRVYLAVDARRVADAIRWGRNSSVKCL